MKLFLFALLAVALQVSSAVESGEYLCLPKKIKFTIKWDTAGGDKQKNLLFVPGYLNELGCKKPISKSGDFIEITFAPVGDAKCGTTPPPATGQVSVNILATVGKNGNADNTADTMYNVVCKFDGGAPVGPGVNGTSKNITATVTTIVAKQQVPAITVKVYLASDLTKAITKAAVGSEIIVSTSFADAPPKNIYKGYAIVQRMWYASSKALTATTEIIKDKCTTGNYNKKDTTTKTGAPDLAKKNVVTVAPKSTVVLFKDEGNLVITVELLLCTKDKAKACTTLRSCTSKRRRRDVDQMDVIRTYANVTVSVKNDNNEKKTDSQPVCTGYTSNTVFYVVVVVLAVLLVITIGVAAYFGAQAKKRVVLAGKDNPVYT